MKRIKCAIIGSIAGFITGFFSAGGGMLILPAIIYLFKIIFKYDFINSFKSPSITPCTLPTS